MQESASESKGHFEIKLSLKKGYVTIEIISGAYKLQSQKSV